MSKTESARAKWTRIIREQRASGLTIAAFCAGRGIAESSFYPWKRKLSGAAGACRDEPTFVEAMIRDMSPSPDAAGGVTIEVGAEGRRVAHEESPARRTRGAPGVKSGRLDG